MDQENPKPQSLKERLDAMTEMPEGFHFDEMEVWNKMEPILLARKKENADKRRRKIIWYACAAAILCLGLLTVAKIAFTDRSTVKQKEWADKRKPLPAAQPIPTKKDALPAKQPEPVNNKSDVVITDSNPANDMPQAPSQRHAQKSIAVDHKPKHTISDTAGNAQLIVQIPKQDSVADMARVDPAPAKTLSEKSLKVLHLREVSSSRKTPTIMARDNFKIPQLFQYHRITDGSAGNNTFN